MPDSPLDTIPLHVGEETFPLLPRMGARDLAAALSPPEGETNAQAVERIIATIAGRVAGDDNRDRFRQLWDHRGQGELLDLWEDFIEHYSRRPTDGPSPFSSGLGTRTGGSSSTASSPSEAAPPSPTSPTTSGDS